MIVSMRAAAGACAVVFAAAVFDAGPALGQAKDPKAAQAQFWMKNLKSPQANLRKAACENLGKLGPSAAEAVPALTELIKNEEEDEAVRAAAKAAIEKITGNPFEPKAKTPEVKVEPKSSIKPDPKTPGAKTAVETKPSVNIKGPPGEKPADRSARLSALVRTGGEADRIAAMEEIARLAKAGESMMPTGRAICEATIDRREPIRVAAFDALEAVAPEIKKAVLTLVMDDQPSRHIEASKTLAQMGTRASIAAPVLLEHVRNPHPGRRGFLKGKVLPWHSRAAPDLIVWDMIALARSSADDPAVLKMIIGVADYDRYTIRFPNETPREDFQFDARTLGLMALAEIADDYAGLRKEIVPVFIRGLGQAEKNPQICYYALRGLARCGQDAKSALGALKGLKLHRSDAIRDAVADAIAAIDPPKIAGADVGEGIILGSGSGFLISTEGHIVTNHHVIEGRGKVMVRIPKQKALENAEVLASDRDLDIAVIKLKKTDGFELKPLALAEKKARRGEEVGALGYPLGLSLGIEVKLTRGIISALPERGNDNMYLLDVKVNPGNSGGPLLDVYGNVAAMIAAKTLADSFVENYGLARPAAEIDQFLRKNLKGWKPAPPKTQELKWADIDAVASPAVLLIFKVQ